MATVEEAERSARELAEAGRVDEATTVLLQTYAAEVYGFVLASFKGDADAAGDAFSEIAERAWKGLVRFEWRCPARAWLYVLARHVVTRHSQRESKRAKRQIPWTPSLASVLEDSVRSVTATWQRTSSKSALAAMRDSLEPDDRMLLVLRVDRALAWDDLARVFLGDAAEDDDAARKREAARLRKRYQLVRDKLVREAKVAGLLGDDG